MAVKVIIDQKRFDEMFDACMNNLTIARFCPTGAIEEEARFANSPMGKMHSAFVYHVRGLQRNIKDESS